MENFNSWVAGDFGVNSALVKENSEYLACSGWSSEGRYVFDNGESGTWEDDVNVVSVFFYENGLDLAYYTAGISDGSDCYNYLDLGGSSWADQNSGWQPISVPEPTSGLLMLLGLAGLALKRRRA